MYAATPHPDCAKNALQGGEIDRAPFQDNFLGEWDTGDKRAPDGFAKHGERDRRE